MSTETNKVLARRVFEEVLNGRNLDLLDELAAPDYIEHSPLPGQGTGIDGIRDRYTMLFKAFDFVFSVDDVIAEDDKVVLRWTQTGTHVGPLFGMPATNRSSRTTGIEIWRVENGKLAEHWDVVDVFGQFMQLGLIPQPTGSPS
ncbi:MAG: ester cyclase [Candidatus Limnocylindrales bacterium]|jgi:Predicted ester cyclase|nr:ester cyclase [Candidatus Limnocylindrales bacterium]